MGNNLFQSLKRRISQTLSFHLLRRKGSSANAVPLAAKAQSRSLWFSFSYPLGADMRTCTAKALLSRQLSLKNLTDYLFRQICCFSLAFQLHKNNSNLKDRKSSILWKTHYPAVYIFSSNTDVSVYYVFLIASYNPCMQHTCKLFMYNYYVASIVVCTTKMTGFYILIYSLPLYISLKDNIHFFRN